MNETENTSSQPQFEGEDEIDLIALAKKVWDGRKTIINTTVIFTVIGLFVAIFTPKQYSVTSILVPQVSGGQSKLGGLSSLAAMAGFNMNMNTGSELSPNIYPQIVQSIPFKLELMHTKLNFDGYDEKISFYDYYTDPVYAKFNVLGFVKKYTIGLPGTILSAIRGEKELIQNAPLDDNTIIQLTKEEYALAITLGGLVYLNTEVKQGVLTLVAIMPEAEVAAQLGQAAQDLLQEQIIAFKIQKAEDQLEFVQERYNERELEFSDIQEKLARFRDRNKNIITEFDKTEIERLQSEYQITFAVFTELAKQLERAELQVKEETPVFLIIEPITVPTQSFKPKRKQIVIIWIFVGVIIGIALVFGKHYFEDIKKKWKEEGEESPPAGKAGDKLKQSK